MGSVCLAHVQDATSAGRQAGPDKVHPAEGEGGLTGVVAEPGGQDDCDRHVCRHSTA